jgi:hypothetical protein
LVTMLLIPFLQLSIMPALPEISEENNTLLPCVNFLSHQSQALIDCLVFACHILWLWRGWPHR